MQKPLVEFQFKPKIKRFEPLLPKRFAATCQDSKDSESASGSVLTSPRSCPATSPRRISPRPSVFVSSIDPIQEFYRLSYQKQQQIQSLYLLETQHSTKYSSRAQLLSIENHIESLRAKSQRATEMLVAENRLLEKLNLALTKCERKEEVIAWERPVNIVLKRLICTEVAGVLGLVEVGQEVVIHLDFAARKVHTSVHRDFSALTDSEIITTVVPRVKLTCAEGIFSAEYHTVNPSPQSTTIAAVIQGYPYPFACLDLSHSPDRREVIITVPELSLTVCVPAGKLQLAEKSLVALTHSERIRLQQLLQGSLFVTGKAGQYSLALKSFTHHLGRLFTKVVPKWGEVRDFQVSGECVEAMEFERRVAAGVFIFGNTEVSVSLLCHSLSNLLRLHIKRSDSDIHHTEEVEPEVFSFLKNLQFVDIRAAPATFFKSIEVLRRLKHL